MTHARRRVYRGVSACLASAFALVGLLFLLAPAAVLAWFDAWSARLGLAPVTGRPAELFVILTAAYMYVVTALAVRMYRRPEDPTPARLLVHAKLASAALSLAVFALRQPQLVLLVNGVVDGAIGLLVLWLAPERAVQQPPRQPA